MAQTLRESAGSEGMRFFPLVFSIFMFFLIGNAWGLFPYFFTFSAHIIVTGAMALLVILTVVIYGFKRHSLGFFRLFVPKDVPAVVLPFIVVIDIMSFLSRPISLSIRLFANMLAGHITLEVFAGFVIALGSFGAVGVLGAIFPLLATIGLTALEALVAALQAYVFAILTCIYLNDALHPSH
jgi:F-type H+-transporting ATPase subunit a